MSLGFLSSKVAEELGGREKRRVGWSLKSEEMGKSKWWDCQSGERGKDWMEVIFRQPSARSKEMGFGEVPRAWKENR